MQLSKFFLAVVLAAIGVAASSYEYERIDKDNALLLIVDIQVGLERLVRDYSSNDYRNNWMAHAELGKVFDIPVIMTTSAETGPNGPLFHEITDMHPDAPLIRRSGEVDAWDNEDFRNAVKATGKTHIILAGIVTDVCTAFLAQSLRAEGYSVWANSEASGTLTQRLADDANDQMRAAGVHVVSMFAVACELMRDWRNTPGALELLPFYDKYMPPYGNLARSHYAALTNGTIQPGEPKP